jgi:hypothetical protein
MASAEGCPKCGAPVAADLAACKACGLLRERFAGYAADVAAAEADPVLEELWLACEANWGAADRHEAFVARASKVGAYALAARRYREARIARPADPHSSMIFNWASLSSALP